MRAVKQPVNSKKFDTDLPTGPNSDELFDNQPKFLSPEALAKLLGISQSTIYDWKYRPNKYGIPKGMFLKFGRRLLIRTDIFEKWFISRCEEE